MIEFLYPKTYLMQLKRIFIVLIISISVVPLSAQVVKHVGSMSEMSKTQFAPTISLDTLPNRKHLVGLGPLGRMEGEVTLIDGKALGSRVLNNGEMSISDSWQVDSPFFVFAVVKKWKVSTLAWTVSSMSDLERQLEEEMVRLGRSLEEPFPFKVRGVFSDMKMHVVLPRSPEVIGYQVGKNQMDFTFDEVEGELVGFYSAKHAGIFTSKTSKLHIHFVDKKGVIMGHVNQLHWSGGKMQLLLSSR